jgi:hypothetical protein
MVVCDAAGTETLRQTEKQRRSGNVSNAQTENSRTELCVEYGSMDWREV